MRVEKDKPPHFPNPSSLYKVPAPRTRCPGCPCSHTASLPPVTTPVPKSKGQARVIVVILIIKILKMIKKELRTRCVYSSSVGSWVTVLSRLSSPKATIYNLAIAVKCLDSSVSGKS